MKAGSKTIYKILLCSGAMSEMGLAVFVLVGFLLPVPILAWLDRPGNPSQGR